MIMIGMPAVIAADILLELERAFGMPFYDATRGGDPLLWQHLFWLFGHPEVYIIFLPAAGMVSMMLPTFARTRRVGWTWLALAALSVGFLSFGLWVHHMFATGLPLLSLGFFSAASAVIAIPIGNRGLRLARHPVGRQAGGPCPHALHPRVPLHLRHRRADGRYGCAVDLLDRARAGDGVAALLLLQHGFRRFRQYRATPQGRFRLAITLGVDALAGLAILMQFYPILMLPICA